MLWDVIWKLNEKRQIIFNQISNFRLNQQQRESWDYITIHPPTDYHEKKTRIWCWCRLICWWIIWSWDSLLSIEHSLIETKITSCIISNGIGFLKIKFASLEICVCAREAVEETDTVPWHCKIFCRELPSITILSSPLSLAFNCINHIIFTGIWIVYDRTSSAIKHCTVLPGI